MTCEINVSDFRFSRISSSVHEMRVSFSTIWANDFAMISLRNFITHTSRARRNALNFFWIMIDASLKSSSIHSANFVRNESYKSSSSSSSHSCILFSSMWVLDSYFFFDFSACSSLSVSCSTLSVDFSLLRIETRLRLANDDSKVICRLAEMNAGFCWFAEMNADLQKWCRLVKMNAR